jgi:UDP-glucose 4-epimerase
VRCLVSGAAGHAGSYLTRLLIERGEDVTILVRPASDLWRLEDVLGQVRVIRACPEDLGGAAGEIPGEIRQIAPETVFHLAWSGITAGTRNAPDAFIGNIVFSLQLFRIAQEAGCGTWVGLGSQAEYGAQSRTVCEALAPRPDSLYGIAKCNLGQMLGALCEQTGVRFVWLRLFSAYGPKDHPAHLIPFVIEKLRAGERPALSSGEQVWDYLYVEDAVEAIYRTAVTPGASGVFNLASGHSEPVRRTVERVRDMIDPGLPLGFGEVPGTPISLRADISKLRTATGWFPETDLETGLSKTLEWHARQRQKA